VKNSLILSTTKDVEKMENDKILKAKAIAAENDAWTTEFANLYEAYKDFP
jgi:hypothetical protein